MRKSNLITGVVHLLIGIICLFTALIFETKLDDTLYWFAGYCTVFGGLTAGRYIYWDSPENRRRRQEILDHEAIEAQDELMVKIKDKAVRCAYTFGTYILCAAFIIVGILGKLEIIADAHIILIFIGGYLVVLLIAEKIIFNHISKKY